MSKLNEIQKEQDLKEKQIWATFHESSVERERRLIEMKEKETEMQRVIKIRE